MTYTQLLNTALELLDEQGPQQAFDFMQQQSPNIEYANPAQLYNFSYCLAAMCDRTDEAMGLLKEAVYTHGYWYDYTYLMEDEDLAQLRSMPEFETIANLCRQRQQAAQQAAQPVLCCEETQPNKPVVLVLHGDQQNAAITLPYWQPVKQIGYALAACSSSSHRYPSDTCSPPNCRCPTGTCGTMKSRQHSNLLPTGRLYRSRACRWKTASSADFLPADALLCMRCCPVQSHQRD